MANKKTVTVTLAMDEMLYDIMNETYLRGRAVQDGQNYKAVAAMYATLDEENRDKITRSIKRAFSEVKAELAEYLGESRPAADNRLIASGEDLAIPLAMPLNFNEAATEGIAEGAHGYIVNSTVADWYLVTNKNDAGEYLALAQKSLESIRKSAGRRVRPVRCSSASD